MDQNFIWKFLMDGLLLFGEKEKSLFCAFFNSFILICKRSFFQAFGDHFWRCRGPPEVSGQRSAVSNNIKNLYENTTYLAAIIFDTLRNNFFKKNESHIA